MRDTGGGPDAPARTTRGRAALAWAALAGVVITVVVLLLLDLLVARGPVQRAFIARNIECLRCHTELIPRLDEATIHQPFLAGHCTSCHTRHGAQRIEVTRLGSLRPDWLRQWFERLGLGFVWRVLAALKAAPAQPAPSTSSSALVADTPSGLVSAEEDLCWTCHANLAPDRMRTYQHAPFAESHCTSCHDPHAAMQPTLLRASAEDVCATCHRIGPELLRPVVHLPFGQRRCLLCHEPHASNVPRLLTAGQRTLCLGCHPSVRAELARAVVHDPAGSGSCTSCHRPHSGTVYTLLTAPTPELCYRCHGGVRVQFTASSRHPVPAKLSCGDCHLPHGAPVAGLLPVAQRTLCLGCHPRIALELMRAVKHEPAASGPCTHCHVPHGSTASPLLQAADPALCRRCHDVPGKPVRSPAPFRSGTRTPLTLARVPGGQRWTGVPDPLVEPGPAFATARGETSHRVRRCADCHEAHASANARLTIASGNALCLRCHATDVGRIAGSRHGGLTCARCHTPHRAPARKLLVAGNPRVCLRCHPGYDHAGDFHPVGARYYDYLARGPLTCTSTCHDPHGSRYTRMLRVPYTTNGVNKDSICLMCHTAVGIEY